jgi:hypothetical protein
MRCYKVGDKIILELDEPIRDRLELIIKVEDPTALPPMEQEPEIVRKRWIDPKSGYGQYNPNHGYTGVEQTPDWMMCDGGRKSGGPGIADHTRTWVSNERRKRKEYKIERVK